MKQIILTILLFVAAATTAFAAKAYSGTIAARQSDGTTVEVRMYGDERLHWFATTDGVLLSRVGTDYYVAAVTAEGELRPTSTLAHEALLRTDSERMLAAGQNRDKFFSAASEAMSKAARREPLGTATPSYFPHTGTPKAIVVLVEFDDTKFTVPDPAKVFDQYLNAEQLDDFGHAEQSNYGSVAQYFSDMSFGQFRPQFDVYGPVTVGQKSAYYGQNLYGTTDYYFEYFLRDAADAAAEVVDFSSSEYDSDDDGYVDLVYFIYAGYGESNGADENTIWPKSGTRSVGTYGGKKICRYGVNNELNMYPDFSGFDAPQINGIGLFCHEFSHTLGLPDMYPSAASACVDNQEMEYWDLMDGGEYVYYGYYPAAYTSWERETMGWKSITTLTDNAHIEARPLDDGGTGYKFCNPDDETDYMVMDVIEKTEWNSHMPGHGLLVYHVCWLSDEVDLWQSPNNTAGSPNMAVVPADGLLISSYNTSYTTSEYSKSHRGDPFPGTSSVTSLSASLGLPNYKWYSGTATVAQGLGNIIEDTEAGTVSFDFYTDFADGIDGVATEPYGNSTIYDLQGRKISSASPLQPGIYISGGKTKIIKGK